MTQLRTRIERVSLHVQMSLHTNESNTNVFVKWHTDCITIFWHGILLSMTTNSATFDICENDLLHSFHSGLI